MVGRGEYLVGQALKSDEALTKAADRVFFDSESGSMEKLKEKMRSGLHVVPDPEYLKAWSQARAEYAVQYGRYLYDQLNACLGDPQAWINQRAAEIAKSEQAAEHIAALPYIAYKMYKPHSDSTPNEIEEWMKSARGIRERDAVRVLEQFRKTSMTGIFAGGSVQDIPCLEDEEIMRLGVLLGVEAYCRSMDVDDDMSGRVHPNLKLEAMLLWGLAVAGLMCAADGGEKDVLFAWNVSNMVCASLSDNIDFDGWEYLREPIDSMCDIVQDFRGILREMTSGIAGRQGRHILVPKAGEGAGSEADWLSIISVMNRIGEDHDQPDGPESHAAHRNIEE